MVSIEPSEYFAQVVPAQVRDTPGETVDSGFFWTMLRRPGILAAMVLVIGLVGATAYWVMRPEPLPALPVSDPPPNGGSLIAPTTVAGARQGPPGNSPILRGSVLPDYDASDVLMQYYISDTHSLISTVAVRGPAEDLPDPGTMKDFGDEWTLHTTTMCSPWYLLPNPAWGDDSVDKPIKSEGYVCWRSSGSFSASVVVMKAASADEAAAMLDEFWMSQ